MNEWYHQWLIFIILSIYSWVFALDIFNNSLYNKTLCQNQQTQFKKLYSKSTVFIIDDIIHS